MIEGLYLSGVRYESMVDGIGVRTAIFVSGCTHNCNGCQSTFTHSFTAGKEASDDIIEKINKELVRRQDMLSGITLSGGDPFCSPEKVCKLIDSLIIPDNNIWAYSGYTYEEIEKDPLKNMLLEKIDVLVDGPFIEAQRNITAQFKGSDNQRIIDAKKSVLNKKIVLWDNPFA